MSEPTLHSIKLPARFTLAAFERLLRTNYAASSAATQVDCDATAVEWLGFYPATMLFSWLSTLALQRIEVTVRLAPPERLHAQVRSVLIDSGIAAQLESYDVRVKPPWSAASVTGLPLTIPHSATLTAELTSRCEHLTERMRHQASVVPIIHQLFEIALVELLENAFEHGEGHLVHYGVNIATSSGAQNPEAGKRPAGLMRVYPKGTTYAEIYLGDLGPGIEHTLPAPADTYIPPFANSQALSRAERHVAFAFEFSTTRDETRRAARFAPLLDSDDAIPLNAVATGLFAVYTLVRALRGQIVVRTPTALLAVDCTDPRRRPQASTMAGASLAPIVGTHYILRLPLLPNVVAPAEQVEIRPPIADTDFLQLFDTEGLPAHIRVSSALTQLDLHLMTKRTVEGTTVIMPPHNTLQSRAEAVFLSSMLALDADRRWLILATPRHQHFAAPPDTTESPWRDLVGPPLLVGNVLADQFTQLRPASSGSGRTSISADTRGRLTGLYVTAIKGALRQVLQRPEIRQSGETFLFEGQYYTELYFNVSLALTSPEIAHLAAEWILHELQTDVLIAHSEATYPLADAIRDLSASYLKRKITVIKTPSITEGPALFASLLPFMGMRVSILTDVICTGKRLQDLFNYLAAVDLGELFCLVDARNAADTTSLVAATRSGTVVLNPQAIVVEAVVTYPEDPPPTHRRRPPGSAERLVVIDKRTLAPTLYVRAVNPEIDLVDLLDKIAQLPDVLHVRHVEYQGTHYSVFVNLPGLFTFLRSHVSEWILRQVDFVARTGDAPWTVAVFDPDDSLQAIRDDLSSWKQMPEIRSVRLEDLQAPIPPPVDSHDSQEGYSAARHWLLLMPAAATGDTTRLFIEFASRHRPRSVLVACVLSRMPPQQLEFFLGVDSYRGASFRMACFLHFPVTGYRAGQVCPRCAAFAEVDRIRNTVLNVVDSDSPLALALGTRVESMRALPLGSGTYEQQLQLDATGRRHPSSLRVLYEVAKFDYIVRRHINGVLQDPCELDKFLQLVGDERRNPDFSDSELRSRLYRAYPRLIERLQEICEGSESSVGLGSVLPAAVHLAPFLLVARAPEIAKRFATSRRDVDDLCVALLEAGVEPGFSEIRTDPALDPDIFRLLDETQSVLSHTRKSTRRDVALAVDSVGRLWARLSRSSEFSDPLAVLAERPSEDHTSAARVRGYAHTIWREWSVELGPIVNRLQAGPLWSRLLFNQPNLAPLCAVLGIRAATLERLAAVPDEVLRSRLPEIQTVAIEMRAVARKLAKDLYSFFVSPFHSDVVLLPEMIVSRDDEPIVIEKVFDYYAPLVCCALADLNTIVSQVVDNWQKHSVGATNKRLAICQIGRRGNDVVLSFGDNWSGEFDLTSPGGLAVVQRLLGGYGGHCEVEVTESIKWAHLVLPAVDLVRESEYAS